MTATPYILILNIKYKEFYDVETEKKIKDVIETSFYSNDLLYISKYDDMKTIQDSRSGMFEIGTVISLLLLLVGMLNYINTVASSMQSRKLTFSIMESVGMSNKQIKKLLIREGVLYAGGSVFITLTIGTGITYFPIHELYENTIYDSCLTVDMCNSACSDNMYSDTDSYL